jgi:hypothetical protein
LAARDVESRVFDRHSGLVGPPELEHCEPPPRRSDQVIEVAVTGRRFRSGRVFAVVTADAPLARDIQAAVRQAR